MTFRHSYGFNHLIFLKDIFWIRGLYSYPKPGDVRYHLPFLKIKRV